MLRRSLLVLGLSMAVTSAPVDAIDHKNLDEGRPLRLDDAYAISTGEIEIEAGAGVTVPRRGTARGVFAVEVLYGALPNFQIGIGSTLSTDPRTIDEPAKSGDLALSALYNFNQETLTLPALGVKLEVNLPTGVKSNGVEVEVKGIVTKSVDRLSLHLNAGYQFLTDAARDERDGRYELVLGASYPIGAPRYTRATLIADVFTEQAIHPGQDNVVGAEVGVRYQLTPRLVWDVGGGTEFAGARDRAQFFFTTGISFGF
jgi:Putative MetA-pathway of phenol degradation